MSTRERPNDHDVLNEDFGLQRQRYYAQRCPACDWFGVWDHNSTDTCVECSTTLQTVAITKTEIFD